MGKARVNLSIEYSVIESARDKGINISSIAEDALRQVLSTFEKTQLIHKCRHERWTWPFSVPTGLAKECLSCGEIKRVYVESFEDTKKRISKLEKEHPEMFE